MKLAKVIGTVVSSKKDPGIAGFKLLLLQDEDPVTRTSGGFVVAADAVGAGVDEYVLYASGSSARQTEMTRDRPCDAVVMAIVDQWSIEGAQAYEKHDTNAGF
ncbi:MAG: microcompartment protein CcmK/EutM, partial [Myxococcota bacterium]